jgi:lipoprotein-anchoring transpeptidase ErfK/SrfK
MRFIRASIIIPILGVCLIAGLLIGFVATSDSPSATAQPVVATEVEGGSQETPTGTPTETPAATPAATPSATPTTTPTTTPTATPMATPTPTPTATPVKPKKPKAATRERKAKNVPERPLDKQTGRRIVYDKTLMTVWVMDESNEVVYRFPVVGRWDRPVKGKYKIFSQSERSGNPNSKVTFDHMTRFAYGMDGKTAIGFHSIPKYYDGSMMHSTDQLGLPVATGGCVRMAAKDAKKLYKWAEIGDLVVVLPSP